MICKLMKLQPLKSPKYSEVQANVKSGEVFWGPYKEPRVGESFRFDGLGISDGVVTSTVVAIHTVGSEDQDKLVLPEEFPEPEHLDFPKLVLGDKLIATKNSIYLLTPDRK